MAGEPALIPSVSPLMDAEVGKPSREADWPSRGAAWSALALMVLATGFIFLGTTVFGVLTERIKIDLSLTDEQLGWLIGPANILFYVLVGIPLARLVDIYPRKVVLAAGLLFTSAAAALGGLVQGFAVLFATRMLVGVGSSAHAPGCYSLMADFFPSRLLPRAIAIFQLGFIGGTTLGVFIGGQLLSMTLGWGTTRWMGFSIHPWQWVLIIVAIPGFLLALGLLTIAEPCRHSTQHQQNSEPPHIPAPDIRSVALEIWQRRKVYFPLFLGVVFCAIESVSMNNWRTPFMVRTYGWTEAEIGNFMAPLLFVSSIAGIALGTILTEWLGKRYHDAHVRALGILFVLAAPSAIAYPLMPTGKLSLVMMALSGMFSLAAAVPQNAAIQLVTPNVMRGQVTAIYVFIFTLAGALGTLGIAIVTRHIVGDETRLWEALSISASLLLPVAFASVGKGLRPYGETVAQMDRI